jgi:hypothetical protein
MVHFFVGDRTAAQVQISDQSGKLLASWKQFGRPSGIFIDRNDRIYVTDSESREDNKPEDYGYNPGVRRGIRIGSVKDGKVRRSYRTRSRWAARARRKASQ